MVLLKIKNALDKLLETLIIVSVAVLTLDVLWQVFTRFVLKNPCTWSEELAVFMIIWVALLGSAVALGRGSHLGVDYFVSKLPEKLRIKCEFVVFFLIAAFSLTVFVIGGINLVISILRLGQISPSLGIEVGYVYLAIPISGFFMTLYSLIAMSERLKPSGKTQATERKDAI
jgi:TRAP-type C4-dicarboxylate transport system permease small subunit